MELRESTLIVIMFGPFVSQTDGFTAKAALTPTIRLSKNGAAAVARNSGTAVAHDENGFYRVTLDSTDTNTLGRLKVMATDAANHLPVWQDLVVIAAGYYDEKYGAAKTLTAATANTGTLDAGASAVDNYYNGQFLTLTAGTGAGQTRRIVSYVGSTKVATVDFNWFTTPISGTAFRIVANSSAVLSAIERTAIANEFFDQLDAIEFGLSFRNSQRLIAAAVAGVLSGVTPASTNTLVFRSALSGIKPRITATTVDNNRPIVAIDLT